MVNETAYAIEVRNISKTFRSRKKEIKALNNVSLSIKKGEIFGLLGPNGAGKTTLLNVITGLLYPDAGKGKVIMLGQDVRGNIDMLKRINVVLGNSRFHWVLRARDILKFYGLVYNLSAEERRKRTSKLVDFFDLKKVIDRKFMVMSTGERARLGFAKAMLNHPELVLMDEPTLGLDPQIAIKVRKEIKRINKTFGTTILLTSHYMQEVEQLSDRVAFIDNGEIIDIGTIEKLKKKKFSTYNLMIELKQAKCVNELKKMGFRVKGRRLYANLGEDDNISSIMHKLIKLNCEIVDIETSKPTLEDYFVKIAGEKK
jgi:ABC-2 type transport system ATP-binding protein